jgi:hypothetical protein
MKKRRLFRMIMILFLQIISFNQAWAEDATKPSLGTCDQDTGYRMQRCEPFSCKLMVQNTVNVSRFMEVTGMENGLCVFNYNMEIRNPQFPSVDFRFRCKLSSKGITEIANEFNQYKEGNVEVYANPPFNEVLSQECQQY